MRNAEVWTPTKYTYKNQKLTGSRDIRHLGVASRLMTDITATFYQRFLPKYASGRLADLGCGDVPFYEVYRNFVTDNICIDWPGSLHGNQYLDATCDLNQKLPFENEYFDTIIISEVLEHVSNPEMIWSEMSRILRHGGKILLSVPFFYRIHEAPHDYFRYTEFALRNFAEKNGLKVLELEAFGGLPEIFADIAAKNLVKLKLIGSALADLTQTMCRGFVRTHYGRKISVTTAKTFPLGYFMVVEKTD